MNTPDTIKGQVVYRLHKTVHVPGTKVIAHRKGDILSFESMNKLIQEGFYEIDATIIVLQ